MIHPSKILAHPWEESKFCNAIMKTAHKKWPCSPTAKKETKIFVLIFFFTETSNLRNKKLTKQH